MKASLWYKMIGTLLVLVALPALWTVEVQAHLQKTGAAIQMGDDPKKTGWLIWWMSNNSWILFLVVLILLFLIWNKEILKFGEDLKKGE